MTSFSQCLAPKLHKFKVPCPEVIARLARLWDKPSIPAQPPPKMPDISISAKGIDKLLKGLSPYKAAEPDKFKIIVLQTLHEELALILQLIFQRSIDTGKIPDIWKEENISPIYKKAKKSHPSNNRPASLTCVLCKILEHIVASSLVKHFTELNIFCEMQHGFREKRSCDSQLILLIDDLAKNMQIGK